jgi:hypothetical protein
VVVAALGILGLFTLLIPVFGFLAFLIGRSERKAMARGEVSTQGRFLVDLGYYLGIISSTLGIIGLMSCCVTTLVVG